MTIPGGIRVKLSLALLVIVGGALLAAYAIIVPSLERRLVDGEARPAADRRGDPRRSTTRRQVAQNNLALGDFVDGAGFVSNSRVVVFGVGGTPGKRTLLSLADSSAVGRLGDRRATRRRSTRPTSGQHGAGARAARRAASTRRSPCRCSPAAT